MRIEQWRKEHPEGSHVFILGHHSHHIKLDGVQRDLLGTGKQGIRNSPPQWKAPARTEDKTGTHGHAGGDCMCSARSRERNVVSPATFCPSKELLLASCTNRLTIPLLERKVVNAPFAFFYGLNVLRSKPRPSRSTYHVTSEACNLLAITIIKTSVCNLRAYLRWLRWIFEWSLLDLGESYLIMPKRKRPSLTLRAYYIICTLWSKNLLVNWLVSIYIYHHTISYYVNINEEPIRE